MHFALAMPLTLLDIMSSLVIVGVMLWHDTTPFTMLWLKHAIGPILVSRWKLAMTSQPTIVTPSPADLLLTNWATGKTAAFDISVTSQLNTHTLMEVVVSAGYAALATEGRKHRANDAQCRRTWLVMCSPGSRDLWCMGRKLLKPSLSWHLCLLHAGPSRLHFQKSMASSTSI